MQREVPQIYFWRGILRVSWPQELEEADGEPRGGGLVLVLNITKTMIGDALFLRISGWRRGCGVTGGRQQPLRIIPLAPAVEAAEACTASRGEAGPGGAVTPARPLTTAGASPAMATPTVQPQPDHVNIAITAIQPAADGTKAVELIVRLDLEAALDLALRITGAATRAKQRG